MIKDRIIRQYKIAMANPTWTDDDSQRAQEEEDAYREDEFGNEWGFFDDAFESWNSLGEDSENETE